MEGIHVISLMYSFLQRTFLVLKVAFAEMLQENSIGNCFMLTLFHGFLLYLFSPLDISHFQEQNDLKGLLDNLHQNIQAKKRKNVEIMWLAATVSTSVRLFSAHHEQALAGTCCRV